MNKDKERALAKKLNLIASVCFYVAAIGFFIVAIIEKKPSYSSLGVTFMCLGTLFLIISRLKKDGDSKK